MNKCNICSTFPVNYAILLSLIFCSWNPTLQLKQDSHPIHVQLTEKPRNNELRVLVYLQFDEKRS